MIRANLKLKWAYSQLISKASKVIKILIKFYANQQLHLTCDPVTGHGVSCGVGWASDRRVPPVSLEKIMKWPVFCLGEHVFPFRDDGL